MGIVKMSLANMHGKLNRREQKEVMAGSFGGGCPSKQCNAAAPNCVLLSSCTGLNGKPYGGMYYCTGAMTHGGNPNGLCTSAWA